MDSFVSGGKSSATETLARTYRNVRHTGVIERPIPAADEGNVVTSRLRDFHIRIQQLVCGQRLALATTAQVLKSGTSSLDRPVILMAIKSGSSAVAQEKAAHKLVLVVTDGLENPSVTGFYARNAVRCGASMSALK